MLLPRSLTIVPENVLLREGFWLPDLYSLHAHMIADKGHYVITP